MEQVAQDIYLPLQYAHLILFGFLALFSDAWRRCAAILFMAATLNTQIQPLVQLFEQEGRPLHVFWTYAAIDILTCIAIFYGRFSYATTRFWGSRNQAMILFASAGIHMYTSVEFHFYAKGVYESGPVYDYYLTLCALFSTMQIAIGLHGIPHSINNFSKFFALLMDRGRLGLVLGNFYSSMRHRARFNEKLFG